MTRRRSLRELARLRGVQLQHRGNDGRRTVVDDEVLSAVLVALGDPCGPGEDATDALELAKEELSRRLLEPVVVHRQGRRRAVTLSLPESVDCSKIQVTLRLEDGTESRAHLSDPVMACSVTHDPQSRTYRYVFHAVPSGVHAGYHALAVVGPGFSARALVVAAPRKCPRPERSWGSFMPLYALRRDAGDLGVGTFRDLEDLGEWTGGQGGDFVGTLPVLAPFVDTSGTFAGPYLPSSKVAWNEAHVDLGSLPELESQDRFATRARAEMVSLGRNGGTGAGPGRRADVAAVLRLKRPVLELLARSLNEGSNTRRKAYEEFVAGRPELRDYARFRAACESAGPFWQEWSGPLEGGLPVSSVDEDAVRYHLYAQWVAGEQLGASRRSGLYLDMPIGVHPSGFDTWWRPGSFVRGVSGGAPPDLFFSEGQSWGFPPLHPEAIRSDGYGYFVGCLRHVMASASMVRVDHVMGLNRLYWVPDGLEARRGAYVRYHADEMHAVLVLEAWRSGAVVVGEDLGTVPEVVRSDMARDGMLSSFVVQFESTAVDPFPAPDELSLASFGTHDLPTFFAYWTGRDIDDQLAQGRIDDERASAMRKTRDRWRKAVLASVAGAADAGDDEEAALLALRRLLEYMGHSPACAVLVDLEDLWLEPHQQNRPGTPAQDGNFSRRAARTFEDFSADSSVAGTLAALTAARRADAEDDARELAAVDAEVMTP